jgi:hypothetical protein
VERERRGERGVFVFVRIFLGVSLHSLTHIHLIH